MRTQCTSVCLPALATLCVCLAGCGSESPSGKTPVGQGGHYEGDGHDHTSEETGHFAGDGHDHGDAASHAHPAEGPHGGQLIELGSGEFHAELLLDENAHRVTIHLLDGAGKEPVAAPLQELTLLLLRDGQFEQYALQAVPSQGGVAGAASQFEIVDDGLSDALCHQDPLRGRIQVTLNDQPYTGTIERGGHDAHEGHDGDSGHDADPGHDAREGHDDDSSHETDPGHDAHEGHDDDSGHNVHEGHDSDQTRPTGN